MFRNFENLKYLCDVHSGFSQSDSNSISRLCRMLYELVNYTRLRGSLIDFRKLVHFMFKIPRANSLRKPARERLF